MKISKKTSFVYVFALLLVVLSTKCNISDFLDRYPPPRGDTIWIHDLPGGDSISINSSLALGTDGSIYYGASNPGYAWIAARIFAVNKKDGSLKWTSESLDHIGSGRIVVGDDGTIYVIGYYTLYAIDQATGAFKWTWEVPVNLPRPEGGEYSTYGQIGALALTDNGDLVLGSTGTGSYNRGLYCIDKDGNTKWYNLGANGWGIATGITIGQNGVIFYYSALLYQPHLIAVEPSSGAVKWKTEILTYSSSSNNIVIADDGFLICSFKKVGESESHLHRIDPATGNIIWSSTDQSLGYKKWIGTDGAIYQLEGGYYYRFDLQTGGKEVVRSGELGAIDNKNRLVFAFSEGSQRKLGIFDYDGTLDWEVNMDGFTGHEILISDNKVIYGIINLHPISYVPTKICAIKGDARLASSGWPRPAHDNRNTSNFSKR